jgi:hypothetical protein
MFLKLVVRYLAFEGYFCVYALCVSESVIDWLSVTPKFTWQPLLPCSVVSVRCVLRLEKQLSIEHMIQHGATRWQHRSR